jgi:hypothetical protein
MSLDHKRKMSRARQDKEPSAKGTRVEAQKHRSGGQKEKNF